MAIDGSSGPLVVRRIVVWRRLEPGDVRTPGTEQAPESEHVEAKVVEIGIAPALRDDLLRLWRVRDEATAGTTSWTARYEPAGVLIALGGGMGVGALLDYLPSIVLPTAASLLVIGAVVGAFTRRRKSQTERETKKRWQDTEERVELEEIEARLRPRWENFAKRLREEGGFRVELRIADVHEAERLVSIDPGRLTHPRTWLPDTADEEVRYGWAYADGRVVEQIAILEDAPSDVLADADSSEEPLAKGTGGTDSGDASDATDTGDGSSGKEFLAKTQRRKGDGSAGSAAESAADADSDAESDAHAEHDAVAESESDSDSESVLDSDEDEDEEVEPAAKRRA